MSGEPKIGNVTPPYGSTTTHYYSNIKNRIGLSRCHRYNQPPALNFSHPSPVNVAQNAQNTNNSPIKIHFDLPLDSSSSSYEDSSSEEDSRFSSTLQYLAQDDGKEECITKGRSSLVHQEEEWWNTQPSVQQLPNDLTTATTAPNKRRRLCKLSHDIAPRSNDADEDEDDHIYIGSSNRVSLNRTAASSTNKQVKRNPLYIDQNKDDGTFLSISSEIPTKSSDDHQNAHTIIVLDDKENQCQENNPASNTVNSNFVYEGLRKSFYESPSLASRWAIATSATKKSKSRRISTSPFLPKDNYHSSTRSTMERTSSAKTLSYLEERHECNFDSDDEQLIPRVMQYHELQHDPIDEFFSDEEEDAGVTKSKYKKRIPCSSSHHLSNRSNKKVSNHTNMSSTGQKQMKHVPSIYNTVRNENTINNKDNSSIRRTTTSTTPTATNTNTIYTEINPYNVSQHRQRTVLGVVSNTTNNAFFGKDSTISRNQKQHQKLMVEPTDTLLEEETDDSNDLLNTYSSRLREAASSALSTRLTKTKTGSEDVSERQVVIDMTLDDDSDDDDDGIMHHNASTGSHTKAHERGLPREECSFSTAPVSKYRNDLFGGSGCGTDGVRILLHDNDGANHDGSTMKKRKRDTTKSKSVSSSAFEEVSSCTAKKRAKSAKGTNRSGNGKRKGKKGFWRLKGKKGYRKRGSSSTAKLSSTKSVWSSRESGVGSYSQGRSFAGISREAGLADVGGASITF